MNTIKTYSEYIKESLNEARAIEEFWKGKEHKIDNDFSVFENPKTGEIMLSLSKYKKDVNITDGMGNVNLVLSEDQITELKKYLK